MREFPEHPSDRVRNIERHLNFVTDVRRALECTRTRTAALKLIDAYVDNLRAAQSAARTAACSLEADED